MSAPGPDGVDLARSHGGPPGLGDLHTVGWVGLGNIGLPMAERAAAAGWHVVGYDAVPERMADALGAGIEMVASPEEVGRRADRCIVCIVRSLDQADDALLGDRGVMRGGRASPVVLMSSVGATGLTALAARMSTLGGRVVDAPILGNAAGAIAGTLCILTSGSEDDVAVVRPLLDTLAASVIYLGKAVGAAQTVKVVVQLRQILGMLATIEGVELADRLGADPHALMEILSASEPTWATQRWEYVRDLWERRDRSTSLGLFSKDLLAALADAEAAGVDLPLTREARRLIEVRLGGAPGRGARR